MPTISWFYGIAIRMYFLDHPPPHFQAVYGEYEANIAIATGEVIKGHLPAHGGAAGQAMDVGASGRIALELGSRAC